MKRIRVTTPCSGPVVMAAPETCLKSGARCVIAKAEWLPGPRGYNARFVVTHFSVDAYDARTLYEDGYCARGDITGSRSSS